MRGDGYAGMVGGYRYSYGVPSYGYQPEGGNIANPYGLADPTMAPLSPFDGD